MPSRLIREGILSSERVEALDFPAEVFYRRLMSKVDDHGLFDARPAILRTSLYPLRVDRVREADITRWIAACEKAGVIALYEHGGKPYLQMLDTRWTTRSEPKFPPPPWGNGGPPYSSESTCKQLKTDAALVGDVVEDGDVKPSPPAQPDRFARFWKAYPRKTGKGAAEKAWEKLKPTEELLLSMLAALGWQTRSADWQKDSGAFIPHPATWLNQRRWEDEPVAHVANAVPGQAAAAPVGEWWQSNQGIEKKALEFGIDPGADQWPVVRAMVFKRAGDGPWNARRQAQ